MSDAQVEMPRYQCHKVVHALKIADLFVADSPGVSYTIVPADKGYGRFQTKPNYPYKGESTSDLGYYVLYEGGYESWSPTKAFEDGYTLITRRGGPL